MSCFEIQSAFNFLAPTFKHLMTSLTIANASLTCVCVCTIVQVCRTMMHMKAGDLLDNDCDRRIDEELLDNQGIVYAQL